VLAAGLERLAVGFDVYQCPRFNIHICYGKCNQRGLAMRLPIYDICPRCGAPVYSATIELAPGREDLALRHYNCCRCGSVKMKPLPLGPIPSKKRF
jgi:hypothetical protein